MYCKRKVQHQGQVLCCYQNIVLCCIFFVLLCCSVSRILVPPPATEPQPQQWEHRVLNTGPPGNSLLCYCLISQTMVERKIKYLHSRRLNKVKNLFSLFLSTLCLYKHIPWSFQKNELAFLVCSKGGKKGIKNNLYAFFIWASLGE